MDARAKWGLRPNVGARVFLRRDEHVCDSGGVAFVTNRHFSSALGFSGARKRGLCGKQGEREKKIKDTIFFFVDISYKGTSDTLVRRAISN